MKQELDSLKENLWMIELLTVEAMIKRPHHFKDLLKLCRISNLEPNLEMSF